MLRLIAIALIGAGACTATLANAAPIALEQVIERHTEAIGGRRAVERVRSLQYALTIVEPQFTVDGIYHADRKLRMRIDVYVEGKRVFTEAYDGHNAWQMGDDAVAHEATAKGAAALRNGILLPGKLFGLHESGLTGIKLELVGSEKLDGTNFHVVKLTAAQGDTTWLYINPETWLIDRTRVRKALHPDVDPTEKLLETRFSDYRKVDGVLRSFKQVELEVDTGNVIQTTTVKEIVTNPSLDDAQFQAPTLDQRNGADQ